MRCWSPRRCSVRWASWVSAGPACWRPRWARSTGTLVKLGQHLGGAILGLLTGSDRGSGRLLWVRYAVLWAMITLGSLAGVFSYLHLGLSSLWIAAGGMLLWATLALAAERRTGPEVQAPAPARREIH